MDHLDDLDARNFEPLEKILNMTKSDLLQADISKALKSYFKSM